MKVEWTKKISSANLNMNKPGKSSSKHVSIMLTLLRGMKIVMKRLLEVNNRLNNNMVHILARKAYTILIIRHLQI